MAALRVLLAAWIGAAVLYVVTSVAEQTSPDFNSTVRDQLATIRFPFYYAYGFITHLLTLLLAMRVLFHSEENRRRMPSAVLTLIASSLVVLTADYFLIYQPLLKLITPAGQERTAQFTHLHTLSRNINAGHLLVMFAAAIIVSRDSVPRQSTGRTSSD